MSRAFKTRLRREHAQEVAKAEAFNKNHPIGTPVVVTRDNQQEFQTITRAPAAVVGCTAVVWVVGIAGCYALERAKVSKK